MGSKERADKYGKRGDDIGMTHFSYDGPTSIETSFSNPGGREDRPVREMESMHHSSNNIVDNKSSVPVRPRPLYNPQAVILLPPNYPGYAYTGYIPTASPFEPSWREPSIDSLIVKHNKSPHNHLKVINARYFVIVMGIMFLCALTAAIFMAIYFG